MWLSFHLSCQPRPVGRGSTELVALYKAIVICQLRLSSQKRSQLEIIIPIM
jgi:hypothetical protein